MCPVILSVNVASSRLFWYIADPGCTLSGLDCVIIPIIGTIAISLARDLACMVLLTKN